MTPIKTRQGFTWTPVNIEEKLKCLLDTIEKTRNNTPKNKTRLLNKIDRWKTQIVEITDRIQHIRNELKPDLEKTLGLKIRNKEFLVVAMFQPSTKNLFLEIEAEYRREDNVFGLERFEDLISLSEVAKVIALLGDAAISMGVLYHLWQPNVVDVGRLTQSKANIVSNENIANLCDRWGLYEKRIHFDPEIPSKSEIEHDKGTLVEAIYGIIQMEYGFEKVLKNIHHLF
ncbi:hypothetical protein EU527_07360 [Candidatus Thorarchaeota archaeon]|nr:MAG: hypothetical protein EU527_07360 [Candidatus Thorarchaeota archaeon]